MTTTVEGISENGRIALPCPLSLPAMGKASQIKLALRSNNTE